MRLYRTVPLDPRAAPDGVGGALWFPREFQGAGRHDNPDRYGCLYCSTVAVSAVSESLAMFRGTGALRASMLLRFGRPLVLVELELSARSGLVDLDDPAVLVREGMRPSEVATHDRARTRRQAAALHAAHPRAPGLRWWSTLESSWINVTLFDRAGSRLTGGSHRAC